MPLLATGIIEKEISSDSFYRPLCAPILQCLHCADHQHDEPEGKEFFLLRKRLFGGAKRELRIMKKQRLFLNINPENPIIDHFLILTLRNQGQLETIGKFGSPAD